MITLDINLHYSSNFYFIIIMGEFDKHTYNIFLFETHSILFV